MLPDVSIRRNREAAKLLEHPVFREQWQVLYHQCPWATIFQSLPYQETWYTTYQTVFEPVLVLALGPGRELAGLLCLALERSSGKLVLAGTPHAEYTSWLARTEDHDLFVTTALHQVQREFPESRLDFCYLPPHTPLGWLEANRKWKRASVLQPIPRPLMTVEDGSKIRESLRKKHNKNRIKQLEKLGKLEFQRVRQLDDIAENLEEIIDFYDFRQGAMHQVTPFRTDPLKRCFFQTLLGIPDLLHTTVWRLNDKPISAHIGFRSFDQVSLGITAYSPYLVDYSPGKWHLYLLGLQLVEDGISDLDLTPGEDSYKERFATRHDWVHRLTIFFSAKERLRGAGDVLCVPQPNGA